MIDVTAVQAYTKRVILARLEYRRCPSAAEQQDWCQNCCYPRNLKKCHVCRTHMRIRKARAKK